MQIRGEKLLTTHELEVLRKLAELGSIKSVADNLSVSQGAILKTLGSTRCKLRLTTVQAIYMMAKRGII